VKIGKPPSPPSVRAPVATRTGTASRASTADPTKQAKQGHDVRTIGLRPLPKSDDVVAAEASASALEQRALRATNPDEKRALTHAALAAWMNAADADVALGAAMLHGAQTNAERAAERLGALATDAPTKHLCTGMMHALHGDLAAAAKSFEAGLAPNAGATSRETRSALRNALHRIGDANAAVALDNVVKKLVSARTDLDPRVSSAKVAREAEALVAQHPRQALAFAALAVEAHAAAAGGAIDAARAHTLVALVKSAAHLQSKEGVPSVATKALLLAHVARVSGNSAGAFAAYRRVTEMASAGEREIVAARIASVQVAFERGRPLDVVTDLDALSARGPLERGLVALATSATSAVSGTAGAPGMTKDAALARIDEAIAALPKNARLVDDASALRQALAVQRRALSKGAAPVVTAARALEALAALEVAALARVPLGAMLDRAPSAGSSTRLTGDAGALVSLTALRLSMLDPVPVASGADHASLGSLLTHVVAGQRGDSTRTTFAPLALSLGIDVAKTAFAGVKAPAGQERVADVHPGAAPSEARLAELRAEMASLLASPSAGAPTNGPVDLDDARRRLVAAGWREHPGTTSLTKDGARIAFDTFSIAQTPSFHAVLETADGPAAARSVHVGKLVFTDSEWSLFEKGFEETMARYQRVLHTKQGAGFDAKNIDDIRSLVSLGRDVEDMPARRAQIAELSARAARAQSLLAELMAKGKAPKGAMIFVEGIDAASKTTNGMNIKRVFEEAGFSGSWLSFKGPTAEERQQHWLKRFQAKQPGENAVFLSDRTFLGDHAYNPTSTAADMRAKADDVAAWERDMKSKGVLVIKLLFDPRLENHAPIESADDVLERPMLTFGKREARALIARDLLERTAQRENAEGLEAATMGPGYNDLKSFHEGSDAMERFRAFADANDAAGSPNAWVRVGTKERHAGRLQAYDALIAQLEAL
jgi:hypothetical protein